MARAWDFACPSWPDRLRRGRSPVRLSGHPLNQPHADRVLAVFENLKVPDLPGQPRFGDVGGQWFKAILRTAAGGLSKAGKQRVHTVCIVVPKKHGKTTSSAAWMLANLLTAPRPRATHLLVGATQEIAKLSFSQAAGMVYADAVLRQRLRVREHLSVIEDRQSGGVLAVRSFDTKIATGVRASSVLVDELHLLTHRDAARVMGQLRGAAAASPELQMIQISTMADRVPTGFWLDELTKARAVRDGTRQVPGYLAALWEFPERLIESGAWRDPENWPMVCPALGETVSLDWMRAAFDEAAGVGEAELRRWASQHLNLALDADALGGTGQWVGATFWPRATTPEHTGLSDLLRQSDQVAVGVDDGGLDDLLGVGVIGLEEATGRWLVWGRAWATPTALERRKSLGGLYEQFQRDGDLRVVEAGQDHEEVAQLLGEIHQAARHFCGAGFDPARDASLIAEAAKRHGLADDILIEVPQGYRLAPGWDAMARRLAEGKLWHAGQPLVSWSVANCALGERGLITKAASGIAKIDVAVALACAARVLTDAGPVWDVRAMIA